MTDTNELDLITVEDFDRAWDAAGRPNPWALASKDYRWLLDITDELPPKWGEVLEWKGVMVLEAGKAWGPTQGAPYRLEDLQPLRDRILVAPMPVPARTKGGLFMAETSHQREKPHHGLVLKVGPGAWTKDAAGRLPMSVEVGDVVFYGKYSGQELEFGGRAVLSMAEIEVYNRLPRGCFVVVEHEDPKQNHLQGDYCDICASPEEKAAAASLLLERERLLAEKLARDEVPRLPAPGAPELEVMAAPHHGSSLLEEERERLRQQRQDRV